MKNQDLTDSQVASINAVLIAGGWAGLDQLEKHGANPASLLNLVKRGMVDRRISVSVKGFEFSEFRPSPEWYTPEGVLKPEKSVPGYMYISANLEYLN